MNKNKGQLNYIKFIFFIRYFADSLFYAFSALYLVDIGLKEGLIGNVQSITTITCLIVNPIWSYFARKNKTARILLVILSILEGLFIILYGFSDKLLIIMIITSLMASVAGPYYNLLDGYAITLCEKEGYEYSNIRVMGSLAYVFGTVAGGYLIKYLGYSNVFIISGALFMLSGILTKFLKNLDKHNDIQKANLRSIIKNTSLYLYIFMYILVVTMGIVSDNFISVMLTNVKGFSTTDYSYVYSAMVIVEVITLLILGKFFRKANYLGLLLFAGIGYFLRSFLVSFVDLPTPILVFACTLRGVAWGTILFVHMKYLTKLVGLENITSAAIFVSVLTNLAQFIISNFFGYVIEYQGYSFTYKIVGVLALVGSLGYFVITLIKNKMCKGVCDNGK